MHFFAELTDFMDDLLNQEASRGDDGRIEWFLSHLVLTRISSPPSYSAESDYLSPDGRPADEVIQLDQRCDITLHASCTLDTAHPVKDQLPGAAIHLD